MHQSFTGPVGQPVSLHCLKPLPASVSAMQLQVFTINLTSWKVVSMYQTVFYIPYPGNIMKYKYINEATDQIFLIDYEFLFDQKSR